MKVELYQQVTKAGRHIRMATEVTFPDGMVVRFMDRLSKREAVRQAQEHRARHPEYFVA
jgi:hypothetical protein